MDVAELDKLLVKCIESEKEEERIPIYAVVAIMGSTEHGAVDPLAEVLELREKYQAKGLSFVVHCDGAWGGYFASMIRLSSEHKSKPHADPADLVPVRALSAYTRKQIEAYKYADSITIDPHK